MEPPLKIRHYAQKLHAGHRVNRMTVRDFLGLFGVERRGAAKVESIRKMLDDLEITTSPDFTTQWIDAQVSLRLRDGVKEETPAATSLNGEAAQLERGVDALDDTLNEEHDYEAGGIPSEVFALPVLNEPMLSEIPTAEDPTYRIGSLPAANKRVVFVNPNDPLARAVTLMLQHDFSQLPVMQGDREVKGIVTWKSIATKKLFDSPSEAIADYREDARVVDSNRTLFDEIPTIVEYGYVLVRDHQDRRITGIVTASDLSLQFQALSQPFLLCREIELHLRQLLNDKVADEDLSLMGQAPPRDHKISDINELTFGEYVRLIQQPDVWKKLGLKIDARVLMDLLDKVRLIRNDVMHFDPDPMTVEELSTLKEASRLMQTLYEHRSH